MPARLPGGDSEPWYRQFWPWFLIALPGSVVVASLVTLYLAVRGADDLVVDEYYKDGLAINRQLEKIDRAARLGIAATLTFGRDEVVARVSGAVDDNQLQLRLSHPMEADRDFAITLARAGDGSYRAPLPSAVAPHWRWVLEPAGGGDWRLDGTVTAVDTGDARPR